MKMSEKCFTMVFDALMFKFYGTAAEPIRLEGKPWVAVNDIVLRDQLPRVDGGFLLSLADQASVFDGYADLIVENVSDYDAIEVHPVCSIGGLGFECLEVCDEQYAELWSVYAHLKAGGVECVGDFITQEMAMAYAEQLEAVYQFEACEAALAV